MKKWLFLGWFLTGCIFTENSGSSEQWLNELGLDTQNKVKSLNIEDLSVDARHTREWIPRSGRAADTVFYQAEYSVMRRLQNRLLLGSQTFGDDPDSIQFDLQLHFDMSDTLNDPRSTKVRDSIYHRENFNAKLELTVSPNFYASVFNNELLPPEKLDFEIEWYLNTWAPLTPVLTEEEQTNVDSLLYNYDYWQGIINEDYASVVQGSFSASSDLMVTTRKDTVSGKITYDTLRTFFEIELSEELKEALVAHRDEFMSVSMKIKSSGTGLPLYIASPDISGNNPQIVSGLDSMPAVFAAFKPTAQTVEGTIYSGVGDTLILEPDFDQIAAKLADEGLEGPGNLEKLLLSSRLTMKMPNGAQLVSPRGHGAWLRIYSELDSLSEDLLKDMVAEYQIPVNDSILGTSQASFWIPADSAVTELSWLVGYGLRRWFNYGSEDPKMRLKLVLVGANQPGDSLTDGNYDPYDQPIKFELGDLANIEWSLDLLTLDPEAK